MRIHIWMIVCTQHVLSHVHTFILTLSSQDHTTNGWLWFWSTVMNQKILGVLLDDILKTSNVPALRWFREGLEDKDGNKSKIPYLFPRLAYARAVGNSILSVIQFCPPNAIWTLLSLYNHVVFKPWIKYTYFICIKKMPVPIQSLPNGDLVPDFSWVIFTRLCVQSAV